MQPSRPVLVHPSLDPSRVRAAFLACLRRRRIDPRFHYESYKQARRWLTVHEAHSPARNNRSLQATYREAFRKVALQLPRSRPVHLISLGCGGGQKDMALLKILAHEIEQPIHYSPVDISLPLSLTAAKVASKRLPNDRIHPALANLLDVRDVAEILPTSIPAQATRIIAAFGLLPNMEPARFFPWLARILRPDDQLLLSANLIPGNSHTQDELAAIIPGYNNPETRLWLLTLLEDLGLEARPEDLHYRTRMPGNHRKLGAPAIIVDYVPRASQEIQLDGKPIAFSRDRPTNLFFSCRYTPGLLDQTLGSEGLACVDQWINEPAGEGIFLVRTGKR